MSRRRVLVLGLVSLSATAACQPDVGELVEGSITGRVVKGPVAAAEVTAYALTDTGRRGASVATATASEDGAYQLNVGGHFGPTLVCARGGHYTEEATGGLVDLGENELCALVDEQALAEPTPGVLITPFTSLHAALTGCLLESHAEPALKDASARASARLNAFLSAARPGFDLRATPPFDPTRDLAPSLTADVWHGLLLSGLSESARQISLASDLDPGVRVTAATLTTELLRDIDDGRCVLDGQGPAGAPLTQGAIPLTANTLRGAPQGLALSIERFLDGPQNQSGVSVDAVKDLTRLLTTHTSDLFGAEGAVEAPVVAILEPAAGPVAGRPRVRVSADDARGVSAVALIAPEQLTGTGETSCTSPVHCELSAELNTALFQPGPVTITARATNALGVSSEASVVVTINNAIPEIEVSAPSAGLVSGVVPVLAQATSAVGIAAFDFAAPGLGELALCAPPATTNCDREPDPTRIDVLWDTATAPEGAVTLTFRARDTAGNDAFEVVEVEVDNIAAGTIAGLVELGYPVVGATITAYEVESGVRGAVIGSAITDDEGRYQIENPEFAGVVEVVAEGGAFEDPSTGLLLTLRAGQALSAAIADVALGQAVTLNVNAWTTLALRRARATLSDSPSFPAALAFSSNLFASHLLRPGALSLNSSASADLLHQTPAPSDAAAIIALTHAGLSRMAAQTSIDVGGAPGQITPVDLLDVLLDDLSDGVLDGTASGVALFLDQESVPAGPDALRTSLAIGVDNFVKNAPLRDQGVVILEAPRNASSITSAALSAAGLLYDDLSLDRSVLFPADAPITPFDQVPPTINLTFAAPNEAAPFGAAFDGVVAIIATASDPSGLSAFEVLRPDVPDLFSPVADIRAEIDGSQPPNQAEVLAECDIAIGDPPYALADASRQVCLCVEAVDALENVARDVQCFTRPLPTVTTDAGAFVGPARGGIAVSATGSFELDSCGGTATQGGAAIGAGQSTASGHSCAVFVPFTAPLAAGAVTLDVDVTEIGGAVSRSTFRYTVDLEPPTLSITAPSAGIFRTTPPLIAASAADANLASVTTDVTTNAEPVVRALPGTIDADGHVTFPPFTDAGPDGLRTITVTATDSAGNEEKVQISYTKDTAPPSLSPLGAADGNPLRYYELTATTAFTPSSQCSTFPFTGCVFDIASSTGTTDVVLRTSAASADTYRRWQHLAGQLRNPSTLSPVPVENRAPTLRLKAEPDVTVEARIDASCPADEPAFEARSRGTFTADPVGLVDVPIADTSNLTFAPTMLRSQTGDATLCLSMRPVDQAGNKGAITTHFFKYEATPAPLHMVWNSGAYSPAGFQEDVEAADDGADDLVLSGAGQGSAGRVFAHAYLVSPSTSTNYNYVYSLAPGAAPTITVSHREVVQVSRQRAFNWCYTLDGADSDSVIDDDDDDLVNPDCVAPNEANSPPDNPTWSGARTNQRSNSASWALFSPTGGSLLSATALMEHRATVSGETDATFSHDPASSYSTSADTTELGQTFSFTIPLEQVSLEVWSYNAVTGQPGTLVDAGADVSFTAGGSSPSSRHRLLLFRAPVPQNAVTLRSASAINTQAGTIGFNDTCSARNSSGTPVSQIFALPGDHWVVADASLPSGTEPAPPRPLLWVASGSFSECRGSATNDCRYGRYFDDYLDARWAWLSGRSLTAQGQMGGVTGAAFLAQTSRAVPAGETRSLAQEQ
ncbi:MAG: carboxypeptidase regulatory-like domain-containing protein [Deltaproteobacteria bacterium]|nr:carboxypeptidase regulatory-like domain-containing protein [Deltaproteobacteria bacterium]